MRIGIAVAALCFILCSSIDSVQSFMFPLTIQYSSKTSSSSLQSSKTPNELFDSPGWESIKKELDQVPIFAVANEEGSPIKYEISKKGDSFQVPLFYTHVSDALVELEKAKENTPLPGMDINPYPLGGIFGEILLYIQYYTFISLYTHGSTH